MASPFLGGLASGLDTATLIQQLMSVERQPQIKLQQQQVVEQARADSLTEVRTQLSKLSAAIAGLRDTGTWTGTQSTESSAQSLVSIARTGPAAAGGYSITVSQLARASQVESAAVPAALSSGGTLSIKSGTAISVAVNAGDTLDDVAAAINATSGTPVTASVQGTKLVLTANATGTNAAIDLTGTSGPLAAELGFTSTVTAQNALYRLGGDVTDRTSQSNTLTDLPGLTLTLRGITADPVSLVVGSTAPSTQAITTKIQALTDTYNATVDLIRGKLAEKPNLKPQTDADRKKGALYGDAGLTSLLGQLRQGVADMVAGRPAATSYASQIGLSTGAASTNGTLDQNAVAGRLKLDTTVLSDALTNRMADVKTLFTNATGSYSTNGLSQRLDSLLSPWLASPDGQSRPILDGRISSQQTRIDSLKAEQARWDTRLTSKETALRMKFAQMESALSQMQSQGSWLGGQLAKLS